MENNVKTEVEKMQKDTQQIEWCNTKKQRITYKDIIGEALCLAR